MAGESSNGGVAPHSIAAVENFWIHVELGLREDGKRSRVSIQIPFQPAAGRTTQITWRSEHWCKEGERWELPNAGWSEWTLDLPAETARQFHRLIGSATLELTPQCPLHNHRGIDQVATLIIDAIIEKGLMLDTEDVSLYVLWGDSL